MAIYGKILEGTADDIKGFAYKMKAKKAESDIIKNCNEATKQTTYEKAMDFIKKAKELYQKYLSYFEKTNKKNYLLNTINHAQDIINKKFEKEDYTPVSENQIKALIPKFRQKTKEFIKQVNNDPNVQKEIRKEIDEYIKKDPEYYSDEFGKYAKSGVPKLTFEIEYESVKDGIQYNLCDESQTMRIIMCTAIDSVIGCLQDVPEFKNWYIHSGDGDEGCLYVNGFGNNVK